jgi:GTP-binding protein
VRHDRVDAVGLTRSNGTMVVNEALFVTSCSHPRDFPAVTFPEIAFVGRSNVGKSSLMNLLLGRRHLVKVSRTPGKTQTINFFSVNARLYFVDLPGYGYARVPRSVQSGWKHLIEAYLTERPTLRAAVFLLDPRRPPTPLDAQLHDWLRSFRVAVVHVATKADQISQSQRLPAQRAIEETLGLATDEVPCFVSAKTGEGKRELWRRLDGLFQAG